MEIERKFKIRFLPGDLTKYLYRKIEQGYLCNNPIIRIRKSNEDYYLTYKSKMNNDPIQSNVIINHEVELPLTAEAYTKLKDKVEGYLICKTRYNIPLLDGLMAELDIFEGQLEGLVFVEVEFPDEEAASTFIPPEWFGIDVTWDKRYTNYYLSTISKTQLQEML